MAGQWNFQTHGGSLKSLYDKDERWMIAAAANARSLADHGSLSSSISAASLASSPSLPGLRIRPVEANPILGFRHEEAPETREWTSHNNQIHREMPLRTSGSAAGMGTRFGYKDPSTGKIRYPVPGEQRFGIAEALGRSREEMMGYRGQPQREESQPQLRRTPSAAELEELLNRRSRARGRGGKHATVVDVVQTKWNVMYKSGSAASVAMITKA